MGLCSSTRLEKQNKKIEHDNINTMETHKLIERITEVTHYTDKLFKIKTTRSLHLDLQQVNLLWSFLKVHQNVLTVFVVDPMMTN